MLTKYALMGAIGVIAILSGILTYKTITLNNTIDTLKQELNVQVLENDALTLENTIYKKDINTLKDNIAKQNQSIEKLSIQKDKLQKTYDDLKKKSTAENLASQKEISKLIAEGNKTDCEYGKDLNEAISKLKYEEL